ncbi:DUF2844 domain-containing protein [Paraburkholderia phosphatilytica]|uniref:DUF2844 domain-containing protein n=1 Tax=Paraburkholderia phosphatilytica TaxID=2282883 RepID=UPI000E49F45A|nr:DUF2844 domain-containing protein [Paraburkholderia phosphatilytica]
MRKRAIFLMAGLCALAAATPASAELGGPPALPANDATRVTTVSTLWTAARVPYTVYQTTFADGMIVKEYAAQAGNVFAVAWNGTVNAPLGLLLGAYLPCYQQAINAAMAGGESVTAGLYVQQSGLAIWVADAPGHITGRVYLPQALPGGMDAALIN